MLFYFCVQDMICVLCALYNIIFVCALCLRHDICFVCYADPGSSHAQAISAVGLFHRPISDKICKRNVVIIASFFSLWSVISFAQSFTFWYDPTEVESFFALNSNVAVEQDIVPSVTFSDFELCLRSGLNEQQFGEVEYKTPKYKIENMKHKIQIL